MSPACCARKKQKGKTSSSFFSPWSDKTAVSARGALSVPDQSHSSLTSVSLHLSCFIVGEQVSSLNQLHVRLEIQATLSDEKQLKTKSQIPRFNPWMKPNAIKIPEIVGWSGGKWGEEEEERGSSVERRKEGKQRTRGRWSGFRRLEKKTFEHRSKKRNRNFNRTAVGTVFWIGKLEKWSLCVNIKKYSIAKTSYRLLFSNKIR